MDTLREYGSYILLHSVQDKDYIAVVSLLLPFLLQFELII